MPNQNGWWCCCPLECGCPEFEDCIPVGDYLVATTESNCPDLDGLTKYFIWGEEPGCWMALQDGGVYGTAPCLILNPGPGYDPTVICCDDDRTYCPDAEGCYRYYLELRAYECNSEVEYVCADVCECGESGRGFYLQFSEIHLDGSPQVGSGGVIYYLCGCDCDWADTGTDEVYITFKVERLLECCCTNLEDPYSRSITATILGADEECEGTMERAYTSLSFAAGTYCRDWESGSPITFQCGDGTYRRLNVLMECVYSEDPVSGGCCDDYQLTLTWDDEYEGCDSEYQSQTKGVVGECTCLPLYLKFGPFRMWPETGTAACTCCEEFYVIVTEDSLPPA